MLLTRANPLRGQVKGGLAFLALWKWHRAVGESPLGPRDGSVRDTISKGRLSKGHNIGETSVGDELALYQKSSANVQNVPEKSVENVDQHGITVQHIPWNKISISWHNPFNSVQFCSTASSSFRLYASFCLFSLSPLWLRFRSVSVSKMLQRH